MANEKKQTFQCCPTRSFKYFEEMKNKQELCDITLHIGSESILAHRIIITAVIPYFRGILGQDNKDIIIPQVEPNAIKCLIEFAYTCEVEIDADNVRNLLAASCYLAVDEVRDACCDFLTDILDYANVLNILQLAASLNCTELLKNTEYYIKRNFEQVSQTKGFLLCPSTYLKELINTDDLVDNEEKVLEAVLKWVKSSPDERGTELPELMRKVRMPLLEPLYLTKLVEREEIIRSSLLCRDLIDEAKNYVLFPELRKSICSFITTSRRSENTTNSKPNCKQYICNLQGEMKFTAQRFDLVKKKWRPQKTITSSLYGGSSALVNNKMYFFYRGGTKEYDPENSEYKTFYPMPTSRIYATATALKNKIYVCGGKIGGVPCDAVERLDPVKKEWTSMSFMKISCSGSSSVALDDYIFVLGGVGLNSVHDIVQRYDSVMDKWKIMSPLLTKRSFAGAAVLNGKIYICGGYVPTGRCNIEIPSATAEMYDPIENRCTFILNMVTARSEFTLLALGNQLCAIGGVDNDLKYVKVISVYYPCDDTWIDDETTKESDEEVEVSNAVLV